MASPDQLAPRRRAILRGIVVEFVETAEPVGSRSLQQDLGLKESPATIRNEMAALEHLGLIFQPFTSAGRVPTDRGFRTFVDDLHEAAALSRTLERDLKAGVREAAAQDDAHQRSERLARVLATLAEDVAFVVQPETRRATVAGYRMLANTPEADDKGWVTELFSFLEDDRAFMDTVTQAVRNRAVGAGPVSFQIGCENEEAALQKCTLAFSEATDPRTGERTIIGLVGPTRMDYQRTSGLLRCIADLLDA